jgi:alkylhydroperoxidase family enzyme
LARVPIWDENDPSTPQEVREALGYAEERFGQNLNIFREMANHPEVLRRYVDLAMCSYGEDSTLTPAHRELAYTAPSVINSCRY